ncbi:MAG TPA: DUF3857 domain-containing protein [Thermoanaerobaculia bacterium]|jgi:tetratricopeptide (TPR) repeat protein/transglutaminase-like putative cysteine protease
MTTGTRRSALIALALSLSLPLLAQQQNPWDAAAFTAEPKALVAAAERTEANDYSVVMLLDEAEYVIDAEGGTRSRERIMMRVVTEAGVEWASEVRAGWAPWHSERPSIEARVVTRDGTVHPLDQSAVVEVPAGEETDIFSDGRILRAPLPAVATGSIIEYVITRTSRNPVPGAGTAVHYQFGGYTPYERTRVILDAPLTFEPRVVNKTGLTPRVEEKDGRRRTIYEAGRIEGVREEDEYIPYDVATRGYLAFSTGKSWQDIATSYSAIVDKQIADSDLEKRVKAAIGNSTDRSEVVAKLLAAIQKDIRYAGVEIGEGSIVPRTPKQVLANKYGDCKDKAAMLVAMLRVAGFPAHVALVNAGTGFDVLPELPGMSYFNHAIVMVEGEPAIWVDPTDVFARAGELPLLDQGRMALIAKPETTTLTRTPERESTAHVYRELRTFHLPEEGKARVVEVTEPSASSEASLRRWVTGFDPKKLREQMEEYAKSAYVAKTITRHGATDANDLTRPFQLTVEVPESRSGMVGDGEATVAINLTALPQHIPNVLRDWKDVTPGESADDAPKKRTWDFLFPQPGVREWVYRIVPPLGYAPRTLPPNETKKLGTTTFSQELRTDAGNVVVATFRFDSGKRRITPAEFEETRVAFTKFVTENMLYIGFEQTGQTKLNAGDVRGALDEYRRLVALHPKEAQHHIETARTLLTAGLGDAARDEIRRAIALEPKNAAAHKMHGRILLHDSLGRAYRKGFDLAGAIAAFRKAKELDPDDYNIRWSLQNTLTYGEDGFRFGRGAKLLEAVAETEAMAKDLGAEGEPMLPELTVLYSHLGRFDDVRALAPRLEETQREYAKLIATAALDGVDAAIRELGAFSQQTKRSHANAVAQTLMQTRHYPQAAALMDLATQGTPAAAEQRQSIDMIKKLRRAEELPAEEGPRAVWHQFFRALLNNDTAAIAAMFPPEYLGEGSDAMRELKEMNFRPPENLTPAVFGDLMASLLEVQQEGDEQTGYRLRMRVRGVATGEDELALYVRRENGRWMVRGVTNGEEANGHTVLAMVANGELEAARKWLNWTREDVKGGTSDDPLEGVPFAALWPKSKTTATAEELRVAAASLVVKAYLSKESEPILVKARETAATDQARAAIDLALIAAYQDRRDWPRMLEVTSRLYAAHADSPTAFAKHTIALLANKKTDETKALANQRLERIPNDRDAMRTLAMAAAAAGDYATAQQYATKIVDELRPKRDDFSRAAWIALFTGQQLDRAIEHARQASQGKAEKGETKQGALPELAALYAETGRSVEARTALLAAIDASNRNSLRDADWYVLGRIAENYGVDDYAITAYRKVGKDDGRASVAELAQRRLEGLEKKTPGKTPKKTTAK